MPDLKRLFRIFFLNQKANLSDIPPLIKKGKYKWVQYSVKAFLIASIISIILKKQMQVYAQYHYISNENIAGIYKITDFYVNHELIKPLNVDSAGWNKIAINKHFPILSIQLINDSISEYFFKVDTIKKFIELSPVNGPKYKSRLYYKNIKANEWCFEGIFKNDLIRVTSKKITTNFMLQKRYGKLTWNRN